MAGIRWRSALAILMLGVLLSLAIGAAGGFASRRDDIPTLEKKLAQCRHDLAAARLTTGDAEHLLALATQKKIVLLSIGGNPFPVTADQLRDILVARVLAGQLTRQHLTDWLKLISRLRASTVRTLTTLVDEDRDARDRIGNRCAKLAEELKQARAGGGTGGGSAPTFTLQPGLTKVTNTHAPELKIDPEGMSADQDHCCDGGGWKIHYSWEVPQTITPGNTYTIMLHIKMLSVTPDQPLGDQMNALAPDFAQAIQAHWPENKDVSKTFTVPLAEDQKDSSDIGITIGFVSSGVIYHYRK